MVLPVFLCVLVIITPTFPVLTVRFSVHEDTNKLKCLNLLNNNYNYLLFIIVSMQILGLNLLTACQSCK